MSISQTAATSQPHVRQLNPGNKADCSELQRMAVAALNELFAAHGVRVSNKGGRLGATDAELKFQFASNSTTAAEDMEAAFKETSFLVGMPAESFGKIMLLGGKGYRIVGLDLKRPKNAIKIKCVVSSKGYTCSVKTALDGLALAKTLAS